MAAAISAADRRLSLVIRFLHWIREANSDWLPAPSRGNRRRGVTARPLPVSVSSVIVRPPLEIGASEITQGSSALFQEEGVLIVVTEPCAAAADCRASFNLAEQMPLMGTPLATVLAWTKLIEKAASLPMRLSLFVAPSFGRFHLSLLAGSLARVPATANAARLLNSKSVLVSMPAAGVGRPPFRTSLLG
jgi:hypothetical protein